MTTYLAETCSSSLCIYTNLVPLWYLFEESMNHLSVLLSVSVVHCCNILQYYTLSKSRGSSYITETGWSAGYLDSTLLLGAT
jgi:hypothetical protein